MRRLLSAIAITVLLLASIMSSAPTMVAQDDTQEPDVGTTPTPGELGTKSPEATTSVYLPLIVGGQGGVDSEQSSQEAENVAGLVLSEEPPVATREKPADAQDNMSEGQAPPQPGLEIQSPESAEAKDRVTENEALVAPAAMDGWTTIMSEGFEGAFPNSLWRVSDNDGVTNGQYYWDDTNYKPYTGAWSAWAARGGANGLNPSIYNYPNNMRSWMVYGPFDLSNATDANLTFYYWNRSEANYDYFWWAASVNGANFYGYPVSGDSGGWRYVNFDLKAVPTLGNLAGRSSVWIAFVFNSDGSVIDKGPFVDNIVLQKNVNTTTCPNQYKAEYFNNRTLSGAPTFTQCENWPINQNWNIGGPGNGVGNDNFSVRWTGTASINTGTYTFIAVADDGIRVWLDGSLIIDKWIDQAPTEYRVNRAVNSGNHSVKVEYYENSGGATAAFRWQPAKKVVLDPGHGWCNGTPGANCIIDPGAVNNSMGMKEKDVVLDIALRTKSLLEDRGVQVYLTRTGDDPYHKLSYVSQYVNSVAPDLSVSIHANAGGGTGTEACYQDNKSTTPQSKDVSTRMTNEIASRLILTNRGIFSEYNTGRCGRGGQLYIHDMNPTAALIETAFIDTTSDVTKLRDRRQDFAQAIANAVIAYLGVQ